MEHNMSRPCDSVPRRLGRNVNLQEILAKLLQVPHTNDSPIDAVEYSYTIEDVQVDNGA
jgi:hypothetical protein